MTIQARPGAVQAHLDALLQGVNRARDELRSARCEPGVDVLPLREALVDALEQYAAELAADGLPLPYKLRDELRLYRNIGPR